MQKEITGNCPCRCHGFINGSMWQQQCQQNRIRQQHPKLRMLQQKPEQKAVKHRQLLRKVMQALS